jgi:uridylate kinase
MPKYNRVIIKISGEALAGDKGFGLDSDTINAISDEIKVCNEIGVQIGIVCGGGNFWRGGQVKIWTEQGRIIWVCSQL